MQLGEEEALFPGVDGPGEEVDMVVRALAVQKAGVSRSPGQLELDLVVGLGVVVVQRVFRGRLG